MKLFLSALIVLSFVGSANAMTLKEKKQFAAWNDYLKGDEGHAGTFKTNCGYALPVTLDEKTVTPFMEENTNAASYCDEAISEMASMCQDATSKESIKKDIKKLSCKLGPKGKTSFKIAGGTLEFTFGLGAANLSDAVKNYLENNLK